MPPKSIAPSTGAKSFSCPHCGALADQRWFDVYARPTHDTLPTISDDELVERVRAYKGFKDQKEREAHEAYLEQLDLEKDGTPRLRKLGSTIWNDYEVTNIFISRCHSCGDVTIWKYKSILYPASLYQIEPNADLPPDARADFEEARTVLDISPRSAAALLRLCIQKLCIFLGKPGKNINDDIASLVMDGLDTKIQKALDIVRVVGNESVHPGTMSLKDDRATAAKLFELVNMIAYDRITHPNEINALFDELPEAKRVAIQKRDEAARSKK